MNDGFEDLRTDAGPCKEPACQDGYVPVGFNDGRPTRVRRCKCMLDRSQARRFSRINRALPATFRNMSFDRSPVNRTPPAAQAKLKRYLADLPARVAAGQGLWLSGEGGCGKTAAACMIVQHAREAGIQAEFWPVSELLVRLARSRHDDNDDVQEEDLHDLLGGVALLVFDDLSAAKTTPWALEQLYVIVNRRYNVGGGRATIVTSDLDKDLLVRMFSRRTIRRLEHMTYEIDLTWPQPEAVAA